MYRPSVGSWVGATPDERDTHVESQVSHRRWDLSLITTFRRFQLDAAKGHDIRGYRSYSILRTRILLESYCRPMPTRRIAPPEERCVFLISSNPCRPASGHLSPDRPASGELLELFAKADARPRATPDAWKGGSSSGDRSGGWSAKVNSVSSELTFGDDFQGSGVARLGADD